VYNIIFEEILWDSADWINLAQGKEEWRALVKKKLVSGLHKVLKIS
jgi:hypothetical protein